MRDKPKRFSISLSAEQAKQLEEVQTLFYPQFSQREILETLIRKGLEMSEDPSRCPTTGGTEAQGTSYNSL
ncbi:MAG: hypothetical protein J5493_04960 [Lachnospiraceae bacterium]|nr:hypothetical protein [Lachnospiraceae bacterium]